MKVLSSSLGAGPRRLGTAMLTIAHCASVKAWRNVTLSFDHMARFRARASFAPRAK